jgi:hypothetical protein
MLLNINCVFYNKTTDSNRIDKLNINLNPISYIATQMLQLQNHMVQINLNPISYIAT